MQLEADQFRGKSGDAIEIPLVPSELDDEIATFLVTERAQALPEDVGVWAILGAEHANPVHLPRLLSPGGERRGEEGEGDEGDGPVHHGPPPDARDATA